MKAILENFSQRSHERCIIYCISKCFASALYFPHSFQRDFSEYDNRKVYKAVEQICWEIKFDETRKLNCVSFSNIIAICLCCVLQFPYYFWKVDGFFLYLHGQYEIHSTYPQGKILQLIAGNKEMNRSKLILSKCAFIDKNSQLNGNFIDEIRKKKFIFL